MKKIFKIVLSGILLNVFVLSCCAQAKNCVAFFSLDELDYQEVDALTAATSPDFNTHTVASYIAEKTGASLFRIAAFTDYPNRMNEAIALFQEQHADESLVKKASDHDSLSSCSLLYLGYPVWLNEMPFEIMAYLTSHKEELSGKEIKIFSTTGSSSNYHSVNRIKETLDASKVTGSAVIRVSEKDVYQNIVDKELIGR